MFKETAIPFAFVGLVAAGDLELSEFSFTLKMGVIVGT